MDWDNIRVFLAVARSGQMLGAARKLGLDHATVSRRIATLESGLGVKLIERRTNGCVLTATGETFLASAEKIETEFLRMQAALTGADVAVGGNVRVGLEDSLFIGRGKLSTSNAEQVSKVRAIIEELGHEAASPDDAREMLGLKGAGNVKF